jgi:hypothetical protein
MLYPDPDPDEMNADPQPCVQESSSSSAAKLAKSLTHDLEFPGLKRKHSVGSPDSTSGKGAETAEYYQVLSKEE